MISDSWSRIASLARALTLLCCIVFSTNAGRCDDGNTDFDLEIRLGFNGTWKLGHVCPTQIRLSNGLNAVARAVEVQCVDGDGVELVYRRHLPADSVLSDEDGVVYSIPIRIGRQNGRIKARALAADGSVIATTEIEISGKYAGLPSDQPLIVALGSAMGVDELNRSNTDGTGSTLSTVVIESPEQLPTTWRGYASCDLIVIPCGSPEFLSGTTAEQWNAIDHWIRRGGGCILSIDNSAAAMRELQSHTQLQQLLPGKIVGHGQVNDPGVLESLVATDDPIDIFPVALIELDRGQVELQFSDSLSRPVPWWIRYAHGSGTIQLTASNLDGDAFANWNDRNLLWGKLLDPFFERTVWEGKRTEDESNNSSYLGYRDLVGQLRATLDVFSSVRVVSFGQIAAMLIGILLLVGPLDYYLSVRWLKRPQFSWYFSGFVLCGTSIGLILLYGALRPDEIRVNSAQIIDIDTESGEMNGTLWAHVYSGGAHTVNVVAGTEGDHAPVFLDWQGLPGRGLGGLLSQLQTDRNMPSYGVVIDGDERTRIQSVGIPAAGTKCLVGTWSDTMEITAQANLHELSGVDQLAGEFVNPLDVDLKDGMLFYHNWFYRLDSRIPPGKVVPISSDTIPKDLARRLNGRRTIDGKHANTKWSPSDRNSLDRLLELMMFYKAAGGQKYTSLDARYQPHIDQSNLLTTNLAVLVGRIDVPLVSLTVSADDDSELVVQPEVSRVWCRFTIPVKKNNN